MNSYVGMTVVKKKKKKKRGQDDYFNQKKHTFHTTSLHKCY